MQGRRRVERPPDDRLDRSPDDAARYRDAAEAALEQLDVGIDYLRRLQKRQLAARLAKNRAYIVRKWMR